MADRSIAFNVLAHDNASAVFTKVARSADGVASSVAGANRSHLRDMAASATNAAGTVIKFGSDSVNAFKSAATETVKLQKVYGGTAEDASRLRFAAKATGTDVDMLAKGLAKASQAAANGKPYAALGIQTRDASGHLKSMGDLLPELADKFSKMQAGPARTAAIMSIFGKSGLALTPILSKNSSELAALGKQSDAYGQTLNGKALVAMKNNARLQREQALAMQGVKVQLGSALMPLFAGFAKFLAGTVIPIFTSIVGWMKQHKAIVIGLAVAIGTLIVATKAIAVATTAYNTITTIVSAATKVWTGIQAAFNFVMSANPIALVVIAITALVAAIVIAYKNSKTFRDIVEDAWKGIQAVVKAVWNGFLKPVFDAFVQAFKDVGRWAMDLWHGIDSAWHAIGKVFSWLWNTIAKPIFNLWKAEVRFVIGLGQDLWKAISVAWSAIGKIFSVVYNYTIRPIFEAWKAAYSGVLWVGGILWNGIQAGGRIVGSVFGAIGRVISGAKDVIVGVFGAIGDGIRSVVNGVIDGINWFIRAIDSIQFHIHFLGFHLDWNGLGIPEIPHLAAGGIVKASPGGTLALLGEGGHDEMVTPLDGHHTGGGATTIINVTVNGVVGDGAATARMIRGELLKLKTSGGVPVLGLA